MRILKWLGWFLVIIFIGLQFYQPDISVSPSDVSGTDLLLTTPGAPAYLQGACYNCHSNETSLPWYGWVNPVGIFVRDHIRDGRKHLNFSIIQDYPTNKKVKKLNECAEEIREKHMPLDSYTWLHPESRLSDSQRQELASWFETAAAAALARDMNSNRLGHQD